MTGDSHRPDEQPPQPERFLTAYDPALLAAAPEVLPREATRDSAFVERIEAELTNSFAALAHVRKAVTFFGSARTPMGHREYNLARVAASCVGSEGFSVITGGGPGVMEAANRGAQEVGALSIGLRIDLPFEESHNSYVDLGLDFRYFFVRKICFVRYATGFVIFPGGFGTLDELFEALTLIQTKKVSNFPVILVGTRYWAGLMDWMTAQLLDEGKISPEDIDLLTICDDPDEIAATLESAHARHIRELQKPRAADAL